MKILLAFLFLTVAAFGQLLPVASLPIAEPPIPSAPPPSATKLETSRWLWGNWYFQDDLKNRAKVADLTNQVAVLSAKLASATQGTGGTSSADILAIKAALASLDTKVNALTSQAGFIASIIPQASNIRVELGATQTSVTIAWDYNAPTAALSGFHIYRSDVAGEMGTIVGTVLVGKPYLFKDVGLYPGDTYFYRVTAFSQQLLKESDPSNQVQYVAK